MVSNYRFTCHTFTNHIHKNVKQNRLCNGIYKMPANIKCNNTTVMLGRSCLISIAGATHFGLK